MEKVWVPVFPNEDLKEDSDNINIGNVIRRIGKTELKIYITLHP